MPSYWNSKEKGLVKWQSGVGHRGKILVFRQTLSWSVHVKSVLHNGCLCISNLVLENHSLCSKVDRMETLDVDLGKGKSRSFFMELTIPLVTWAARLDINRSPAFRHELVTWKGQEEIPSPVLQLWTIGFDSLALSSWALLEAEYQTYDKLSQCCRKLGAAGSLLSGGISDDCSF